MLPGGICEDGQHRRDYAFHSLTGALELAVAEAAESTAPVPERVTTILACALADLGGKAPTVSRVTAMCVGDRQYLMTRLAAILGVERQWRTARCGSCGNDYDVLVDLAAVPVQEAGRGYPRTRTRTGLGRLTLRVPDGADQLAVTGNLSSQACLVRLAARCVLSLDGRPAPEIDELERRITASDLAQINAALDRLAPQLPTSVRTSCPDCRAAQRLPLDPYLVLSSCSADTVLAEIHQIARCYSWSQAEILSLPTARRRRYLALLEWEHRP